MDLWGNFLGVYFPTSTVDVQYDSVNSVTVKDSLNTTDPNTFLVLKQAKVSMGFGGRMRT